MKVGSPSHMYLGKNELEEVVVKSFYPAIGGYLSYLGVREIDL